MSLEGRLEVVAAKLSSRGKLPVEGSERGFGGWAWEDLKGQRQVLKDCSGGTCRMCGVCVCLDLHTL